MNVQFSEIVKSAKLWWWRDIWKTWCHISIRAESRWLLRGRRNSFRGEGENREIKLLFLILEWGNITDNKNIYLSEKRGQATFTSSTMFSSSFSGVRKQHGHGTTYANMQCTHRKKKEKIIMNQNLVTLTNFLIRAMPLSLTDINADQHRENLWYNAGRASTFTRAE